MTDIIIVAIISFAGTMAGTFGGIITSAKLTSYRIKQLEIKVDKHNRFAERIPLINQRLDSVEEDVRDMRKSRVRSDVL